MMQERYTRQIMIPEVGEAGQRRWQSSRVLVIGAGGLGCPLLMELVGAGVGAITLIDGDTVSLGNLNRQFLYTPQDIGKKKAPLAAARLRAFAPELKITAIAEKLTEENAKELLQDYDLVLLAVDNLPTRLLVNQALAEYKTPIVNGGVYGFYGNVATVEFGKTPCLECLYSQLSSPPDAAMAIGAVSAAVASLMANAALWMLLGKNPLAGRLLLYDGTSLTTETISLRRTPGCPVCGGMGENVPTHL